MPLTEPPLPPDPTPTPPSAARLARSRPKRTELDLNWGARLRGRTATQRSKKVLRRFWKGFRGRVLRRVLRRGSAMGFTVKRVLRRVLRRGSEKGVSRRCPERPLGEYAPLGVRPINGTRDGTKWIELDIFQVLWDGGLGGGFVRTGAGVGFCGFPLRKNQERASKFGSILGRDRGLVNNCSAALDVL